MEYQEKEIEVPEISIAIIGQAVNDYKKYAKAFRKYSAIENPSKREQHYLRNAQIGIEECEQFFLSAWFCDLSCGKYNGENMIRALRASS